MALSLCSLMRSVIATVAAVNDALFYLSLINAGLTCDTSN